MPTLQLPGELKVLGATGQVLLVIAKWVFDEVENAVNVVVPPPVNVIVINCSALTVDPCGTPNALLVGEVVTLCASATFPPTSSAHSSSRHNPTTRKSKNLIVPSFGHTTFL
jgi:hypothetical protein